MGSSLQTPYRGPSPDGTPDRSKLVGSHGQRPWLHEVVIGRESGDAEPHVTGPACRKQGAAARRPAGEVPVDPAPAPANPGLGPGGTRRVDGQRRGVVSSLV